MPKDTSYNKRKGAVVMKVGNKINRIEIRFDKKDEKFFFDIGGGERYSSASSDEIKREAEEWLVALSTSSVGDWTPVVEIYPPDKTKTSLKRANAYSSCNFEIFEFRRFYLRKITVGNVRFKFCEWTTAEEKRDVFCRDYSTFDFDGGEELPLVEFEVSRIYGFNATEMSESKTSVNHILVPYSDELWQTLLNIQNGLAGINAMLCDSFPVDNPSNFTDSLNAIAKQLSQFAPFAYKKPGYEDDE